MDIFVDSAADKKAPLFCASRDWSVAPHDKGFKFTFKGENKIYPLPNLIGNHQIKNAGLALAALEVIKDKFPVPETDKQNGLQKTTWKGRLERITQSHLCNSLNPDDELWYDGGHNDSAGHAIAEQIKNWNINNPKSTHLILGMKADKRPMDYLKSILPQIDSLTITKVNDIGPCITADHVEPNLKGQSICFLGQENDLDKAIANIMSLNPSNEPKRIMICGSLYLAEKL
jgi:dihydrofolate synthase/folylpolyglutamate synthase